jgi:hypothetical protein
MSDLEGVLTAVGSSTPADRGWDVGALVSSFEPGRMCFRGETEKTISSEAEYDSHICSAL